MKLFDNYVWFATRTSKSHQETETKESNKQNSISDYPAIDLGLPRHNFYQCDFLSFIE